MGGTSPQMPAPASYRMGMLCQFQGMRVVLTQRDRFNKKCPGRGVAGRGEEGRGGRRLTVPSDAAFASGPRLQQAAFSFEPCRRQGGRCREDDCHPMSGFTIVSPYAVAGLAAAHATHLTA
jgi:hypothetical protein